MKQIRLRADNRLDVLRLSQCILTTPATQYPVLLAVAHHSRLMRFRVGSLTPLLWLVRALRGRAGLQAFFTQMQKREPSFLSACIVEMVDHIRNGTDTEDPASVGGWSQREIDRFQEAVSFTALQPGSDE